MKKNILITTLLLTFITIYAVLIYIFINPSNKTAPFTTKKSASEEKINTATPVPIEVFFEYTVKSIDQNKVVINGKKGDMIIPLSDQLIPNFKVHIYHGYPPDEKEASINDLKVGQGIRLTIIPAKEAWIYIIK